MSELRLPLIPLVGPVLYPGLIQPLSIGRPRSIRAALACWETADKMLAIFSQNENPVSDPGPTDLRSVGVRALVRSLTQKENSLEIVVQGIDRVRAEDFRQTEPYLMINAESLPFALTEGPEVDALERLVNEQACRAVALAGLNHRADVADIMSAHRCQKAYILAHLLNLPPEAQQKLLEASNEKEVLELLHGCLAYELTVLEVRQRLTAEAQEQMGNLQKEQVLRQQLTSIRRQLGEDRDSPEVAVLRQRLEKSQLPVLVKEEADRQLHQLEGLTPVAPEYQVARSHLELIMDLPWAEATDDQLDLTRARQILNQDHYGLQKVTERILEHLAVMKLNPAAHAPILCFVGPPGTGKTSLGESIARALNRKFERMSLGGMHDEAELRGHRRTYVGAMAGRIIQALRRAKAKNPLIMLDEVDKLCHSYQGDPASALLEILDPAQNREFHDNYLDLPFDLSQVFFITTANTLDTIPPALLDRMEVIRLSGYTPEEKLQIAVRHLVRRQICDAGLSLVEALEIPEETLTYLISHYTREAGIRQLERTIARLVRRLALRKAEGGESPGQVTVELAEELLGPEAYLVELARASLEPGVATGLAWTESGGDILYVEVALLSEGEEFIVTGNLGEVMKESARTARSYIVSQATRLGLDPDQVRRSAHIHVPAGATPKDGPSAGLAMICALVSAISGVAARADTAMSGEITLSGLVLPVGGIKEKLLAAQRAGLKRVLLPRLNAPSLSELPKSLQAEMEILFVDHIEEAVHCAIPGLRSRVLRPS